MTTLVFHNPGEIDIRGACIAGLSAKETKSPIGYFGTGLKYAIASILRWKGFITIYSGETKYTFASNTIDYRGREFGQIIMLTNDQNPMPLGFTTEYGKNWEPWQVFRELYANARDENGDVDIHRGELFVGEGRTAIFINCSELIEEFHARDKIILPARQTWEHENAALQFNPTPSHHLFYRGVRVEERACLYTWNILTQMKLTEDRTLTEFYYVSNYFDNFLLNDLHDVEVIMSLLRRKIEGFEDIKYMTRRDRKPIEVKQRPFEGLLMDWFGIPQRTCGESKEFKEACIRLYQRDPTTFSKLRSYVKSIDSSLVEEKHHEMTPREQLMFDKAKELVALFGFEDEIARLPIYVQELGGRCLGLYEQGTIYLSPKLFDQGTKQLVATLYEECYHHRTQNRDETYQMQNDLFNIIISLNEELHKVIC